MLLLLLLLLVMLLLPPLVNGSGSRLATTQLQKLGQAAARVRSTCSHWRSGRTIVSPAISSYNAHHTHTHMHTHTWTAASQGLCAAAASASINQGFWRT